MKKITVKLIPVALLFLLSCFIPFCITAQATLNSRQDWLNQLDKLARPVMENLAAGTLKSKMPVELAANSDNPSSRKAVSYLEAFGRTLSGIGPWLNLEDGSERELALRRQYRQWALKAVSNAVDPSSPDYLRWEGGQPLVDASFFALGLIRCPWLWNNLDTLVKQRVETALKVTRNTVPGYSNWILFSGMIEAFFCNYGLEYDKLRIEYAVREFANHWYVGDGMFSDGMSFHLDYYNSIVIHPFLSTIVSIANKKYNAFGWFVPKLQQINQRYAEVQERYINADGTYPVISRSIAYRGGVFHHLSDIALKKQLPASLKPAQVRSALSAVMGKVMTATGTYNQLGWLNIGMHGAQPTLGEFYITTGSLYICANIFLPLGLPATDEFWSAPAAPWTAVRAWSGEAVEADHAMDLPR